MEKDSKTFAGGAGKYSIDDILEEARRHQTEQKSEQDRRQQLADERRQRTQTDIDSLLQAYGPPASQPPAEKEISAAPVPAQEPEETIIPDEKPTNGAPSDAEAKPQQRPIRGKASSAISATGTLFETISVEKDDANDYSHAPKRRSEPSAPAQTDLSQFIKHTQKAAPEAPAKPEQPAKRGWRIKKNEKKEPSFAGNFNEDDFAPVEPITQAQEEDFSEFSETPYEPEAPDLSEFESFMNSDGAAEEENPAYISPLTETEFQPPEPVQTGFTEYIPHTPKPEQEDCAPEQPQAETSAEEAADEEAEQQEAFPQFPPVTGNHLYYLGQDDENAATPHTLEQEAANLKKSFRRFIKPKKTIHTGEEPVNITIQQQSEEVAPAGDEKFIRPDEPVKTEADVQINAPDEEAAPAKRFIHPPTVKTAPLPVINTPEDYILGDGEKYIKVPDDYVDPFAEKKFDFGEEDTQAEPNEAIPADGNTIVAPGADGEEAPGQEDGGELDGQIRLDGFAKTEQIETIDEEEAEQMVFENRREKVNSFRLHEDAQSEISEPAENKEHEPEPTAMPEATQTFEYRSPGDAPRIREELNAQRAKQALKIFGLGVIEIILLWMSLSAQFSGVVKNPASHLSISLLLTLIAAAIGKSTVIDGIKAAINRRFGAQSVLTAALAASALHNVVLFGFTNQVAVGACHIYTALAVASLLCAEAGEFVRLTQTAFNFSFLRSKGEKQCVLAVENAADAEEISRGAAVGDTTDLCYSTTVDFPAAFLTLSKNSGHWDKNSAKYMPWFYAAAGLVFILSWICRKSFIQAFSGFTALACIFAPLTLFLADTLPMRAAGKTLNRHGAMLAGTESAAKFADINGVLLDATDLFPSGSTQLYGLKAFHSMRIDDAILYAAGVLSAANAPLSSAFDLVIEQRREMLPEVETLTYEDGMGLSGWIYDNRVLLGNRELMLHHGVEMPPASIEKKYLQGDPDRKPLYMSVAGRLAAMFVVGYSGSGRIARMLGELEENGICLLLRTSDPNIDEAMIAHYFDLSEDSVKILSSVGGLLYTEKLHAPREKAPAHIVHNGSLKSFVGAITACIRLKEKIHFSMLLQALGIGLGALLIAFFSVFAGLSQIGVFQLLVFEAFWCLVVILSASMRKP